MTGSGGACRQSRDDPGPFSTDAEVEAIMHLYQRQLIGLRRRFQAWQIPAVLRELQRQRDDSLKAVRERHAAQRFADRERLRRARPFPALRCG